MPLPSDYAERVYAGVLGKIIGVYLGRPFEQWSFDQIAKKLGEVEYYVHEKLGQPLVVTDDDISGTFTFIRALEDHGYDPEITAKQIGETWLNYIIENRTILWWGGMGVSTEHTAFLRLKSGIAAPASGSIATNGITVAEQIGAQIFIDGWAMVCPNDPARAAHFARLAGSVSHDGAALDGAAMIAAMESAAFGEDSIDALLDIGLQQIPADGIIAKLIEDVRNWHAKGLDWRAGYRQIESKYGYGVFRGGCHIVPNHALIIHALLHGNGDFAKSMKVVNTCGWDTDCNAGNLGCLLGIRGGIEAIEDGPDWIGPIADRMFLPTADGGRCITNAASEAMRIVQAGHAMDPLSPPFKKPKRRFKFPFPRAVQGFRADNSPECRDVAQVNGVEGLLVTYKQLANGRRARVMTPTFASNEDFQMGGYGLIGCPTLYPGQKVTAKVKLQPFLIEEIHMRIVAKRHAPNGAVELLNGPLKLVRRGEPAELSFKVPQSGGYPVFEVGLEAMSDLAATGSFIVKWLDWTGLPTGSAIPASDSTAAQRSWVNAASILEAGNDRIFVVSNEGLGLAIHGCREWRGVGIEAEVQSGLARQAGVAINVQGTRRFVALTIGTDGVRLFQNGQDDVAHYANERLESNRRYRLRLWQSGDRIFGSVDDHITLELSEFNYVEGAIGLVVEDGAMTAHSVNFYSR